ncbi:esterase/lipase family protein [Candidatus Nitrosacidococcus tergens]|uniref:AB hydrolase-1 domain-containing protein n=1 Tax=Candidatus Nitrosacidococcus tergens TaxID=553981 RepID=A0A7G1Q9I9_9GAMM|nr:alpha/beta hydrolase [Candidatus Nitrosacidococcus tergens]CAB1276007.1 conserved protein of unknown function [Candidatus Nitrosacidococcus tergens]
MEPTSSYSSTNKQETIVLLHGLWMYKLGLYPMAKRLRSYGYHVICFGYPSVRKYPKEIVETLHQKVIHLENETIHFVGHSLGGLLIQHFFETYPDQKPGRVIALGSPFASSKAAHRVYTLPLGRHILGKCAGEKLLLEPRAPWHFKQELGVISGTRSADLGKIIAQLSLPNDGTVTVEETKQEGMTEHCLLEINHNGLLFSPLVVPFIDRFLQTGRFKEQ